MEDHPLDYCGFEGVIPKGHYGAGTVVIWDDGTYAIPGASTRRTAEKAIDEGLKKGHLEFELFGKKLKGIFVLIKIHTDEKSWLFIKKKDDFSNAKSAPDPEMPHDIKPMLATLIAEPFDSKDWLFEMKWDGYRALAYVDKDGVELRSRTNHSFNELFSPIVDDLKRLKKPAIFDGEVVVLDEEGRSRFQLMQNYQRTHRGALFYYVFDLLYYRGQDLRELPLIERKEVLQEVLSSASLPHVRFSEHIERKGKALFRAAQKKQLEGIIGKEMHSKYVSARSREWVKIKTHLQQEAVIAGFTAPRGSRKKLGALLLGVYEKGKLVYIGHAGGGFNSQTLNEVYEKLQPLIQSKSPFENPPKPNMPVTWVKPKLVCEITFSEWTDEGIARQPIFQGLRLDKKPKDVKREIPK